MADRLFEVVLRRPRGDVSPEVAAWLMSWRTFDVVVCVLPQRAHHISELSSAACAALWSEVPVIARSLASMTGGRSSVAVVGATAVVSVDVMPSAIVVDYDAIGTPDGQLPPSERARRMDEARKAAMWRRAVEIREAIATESFAVMTIHGGAAALADAAGWGRDEVLPSRAAVVPGAGAGASSSDSGEDDAVPMAERAPIATPRVQQQPPAVSVAAATAAGRNVPDSPSVPPPPLPPIANAPPPQLFRGAPPLPPRLFVEPPKIARPAPPVPADEHLEDSLGDDEVFSTGLFSIAG
jgi:hypothetical protein